MHWVFANVQMGTKVNTVRKVCIIYYIKFIQFSTRDMYTLTEHVFFFNFIK